MAHTRFDDVRQTGWNKRTMVIGGIVSGIGQRAKGEQHQHQNGVATHHFKTFLKKVVRNFFSFFFFLDSHWVDKLLQNQKEDAWQFIFCFSHCVCSGIVPEHNRAR